MDDYFFGADSSEEDQVYTPSATATRTSSHETVPPHPEPDLLPTYASISRGPSAAVPPHKDATFLIRDRATGLVIALEDGELGLHPDEKSPTSSNTGGTDTDTDTGRQSGYQHSRGSHWRCIENDELWLGFRNSVSREYIGHNGDVKGHWRFIAEKKHHESWEWFCAREQHPDGGHVLLVKHKSGFRAMRAGGEGGRELVVAGKGEAGTAWDFIKVR
ncbi:hypothetical protein ASPCAL01648 [Aspergillus calidoustus]|uniref:Uncharacterized protein n=1 Tax=Aspergillus calidoustus TaxID=454130 RepID=A0A0U5C3T1_ASPCI|nr:hypothetical protein ASPCAL01648 [Aspergillus calidoustus]